MENKTDREKMLNLLNQCNGYKFDSIEGILDFFLHVYINDISVRTMYSLMDCVNKYLGYKVDRLDKARFVANERAGYIKKYLEGKMWPNEELAKQYLQPQIDNAQAIIDACKEC